jgi:DNA-binding sugar fermentation-stimulating protein
MNIKYRFAITSSNEIVDIMNIKDRTVDYYCLGCNSKLIPRLGEIRIKHFAHSTKEQVCSYETYLHQLAKKTLFSNISKRIANNMPFYIRVRREKKCIDCTRKNENGCFVDEFFEKVNILIRYKEIYLEKSINNYRPDVLLIGNKKHLFLEIKVKHACEKDKIESDNQIIEIPISSEDDIRKLQGEQLDLEDISYRHNIQTKPIIVKLKNTNKCKHTMMFFIVYMSGKCILVNTNDYVINKLNNVILYKKEVSGSNLRVEYVRHITEAYENRIKIKNCHLCRYHGLTKLHSEEDDYIVFCKFLRVSVNSNKAAECDYFKIDRTRFTIIKDGNLTTASTL